MGEKLLQAPLLGGSQYAQHLHGKKSAEKKPLHSALSRLIRPQTPSAVAYLLRNATLGNATLAEPQFAKACLFGGWFYNLGAVSLWASGVPDLWSTYFSRLLGTMKSF